MAILTTAIGKDITLLRPDYFFIQIFTEFLPYLTIVALLVLFGILEMQTTDYTGAGLAATAKDLIFNFAVQVIAIFSMRSIGLYYRHYNCHFNW